MHSERQFLSFSFSLFVEWIVSIWVDSTWLWPINRGSIGTRIPFRPIETSEVKCHSRSEFFLSPLLLLPSVSYRQIKTFTKEIVSSGVPRFPSVLAVVLLIQRIHADPPRCKASLNGRGITILSRCIWNREVGSFGIYLIFFVPTILIIKVEDLNVQQCT